MTSAGCLHVILLACLSHLREWGVVWQINSKNFILAKNSLEVGCGGSELMTSSQSQISIYNMRIV